MAGQPRMHLIQKINGKLQIAKEKSTNGFQMNFRSDTIVPKSDNKVWQPYDVGVYCYKIEMMESLYWPEAREGGTCVYANNRSYYIGGMSVREIPEFCYFDHGKMKWCDLQADDGSNLENLFPASYHSTILYKEEIIGYGGGRDGQLNKILWSLDVTNHTWQVKTSQGDTSDPRKCHIGCLVGNGVNMLVHGGYDTNGAVLSQIYVLNLSG
jgi:hypothetical protein